jgi:hypothetical protein
VEELFAFEDSIICVETFAAKVSYKGMLEGKNILPSRHHGCWIFCFIEGKSVPHRFSVSAALWQQFHHWVGSAGCLHCRPSVTHFLQHRLWQFGVKNMHVCHVLWGG